MLSFNNNERLHAKRNGLNPMEFRTKRPGVPYTESALNVHLQVSHLEVKNWSCPG